jgi:hypothetical protein
MGTVFVFYSLNLKKEGNMKTMKYAIIAVLAVNLIAGCRSPVYVQSDNSVNLDNYKTYMWIDTRTSETDNSSKATAFADLSVRNEANAILKQKGWREVTSDPDVLIGYDILVERSTEQRSDPVYTNSFTRSYYNPYTRRWSTIYYPSQFLGYDTYEVPVKEGTITISMIDARTDKAIWQGWTTESMNYSRFTDDELHRSVRNIFRKF